MSKELGLTSTRGTWTSPNPQFHSIFDEFNAEPEELSCSPLGDRKATMNTKGEGGQKSATPSRKEHAPLSDSVPTTPQPLPSAPLEGTMGAKSAAIGIPPETEPSRRVALSSSRTPSPARAVREMAATAGERAADAGAKERENEKGKECVEDKDRAGNASERSLEPASTWIKHKRSSGNSKDSDAKEREKETNGKGKEQRRSEEEINDSKRKMQAAGSSASERLRSYVRSPASIRSPASDCL